MLAIPTPQWSDITALAPAAIAVAFLAFSDGILLAQIFAEKHGYEVDSNRELFADGSANILASLWQGFPVSANKSRTSIIDAQAITDMNVTAAQRFAELYKELSEMGIEIKIADAPRPLRKELARVGMGEQPFYYSVKRAVEAFEQKSKVIAPGRAGVS